MKKYGWDLKHLNRDLKETNASHMWKVQKSISQRRYDIPWGRKKIFVFKEVKQDKEEEEYWMRGEQPQVRMENGVGVWLFRDCKEEKISMSYLDILNVSFIFISLSTMQDTVFTGTREGYTKIIKNII